MALGHLAGILCGVIVVSNGMVAKKEERERTANQGYRNDDVMSVDTARLKRGFPDAIETLLKRARLIFQDWHYKRFTLHGGYSQAIKDFKELHPTHVEDHTPLVRGRVGQSTVTVNKSGPTAMTIVRETLEKDGILSVEVDVVRYLD